jgi:hypothetical protein
VELYLHSPYVFLSTLSYLYFVANIVGAVKRSYALVLKLSCYVAVDAKNMNEK